MIFSDKLDADARHELAVVDAVVSGGEARPEDAELTDFALLVRSARQLPDHAAAAAIDSRIQAAVAERRPRQRRRPLLALAAGVATLIVVATVTAQFGGSETTPPPGPGVAGSPTPVPETAESAGSTQTMKSDKRLVAPQRDFSSGGGEAAQLAPDTVAPTTGPVTGSGPRQVARDASLTLAADDSEVERLADRVIAATDTAGGYVAQSSVETVDAGRARADFLLMIPAARFQETLARLSRLAHVRSRSQSATDITTEFNAAERALQRARQRVTVLKRQFAAAENPAARAAIARRLARAQAAERAAATGVRAGRSRVRYVPLELKVISDPAATNADRGTIGRALSRAGRILTGALAVLIVALAILLPIMLIGLLAGYGVRRWRRRSAEHTIDAAAGGSPEVSRGSGTA
jgi:hypothetical protein